MWVFSYLNMGLLNAYIIDNRGGTKKVFCFTLFQNVSYSFAGRGAQHSIIRNNLEIITIQL